MIRVTGRFLAELDHLWTGESEILASPVYGAKTFYANIVFKAGLTVD